jgi:Na+-transporting NADH:ubiquinone oxidoreductase subunit F
MNEIILGVVMFTAVILGLVLVILMAKSQLVASGPVTLNINGEKDVQVSAGGKLLNILADEKLFVSSACGGGGTCGH